MACVLEIETAGAHPGILFAYLGEDALDHCCPEELSLMTLSRPSRRAVAFVQAGYYGPSGLWPIFSLRSFEWITGPKVDGWLVKTVGALVSVVGGVLGLAASRRRLTPEMELLALERSS